MSLVENVKLVEGQISAEVIADSVYVSCPRITTFVLRYPRIIHSEIMTHRAFSRNAASSRAIPVAKQLEKIKTDPFIPVRWGANQKGMQARSVVAPEVAREAEAIWLETMRYCVAQAEILNELGIHKQIVNRIVEPFSFIET